MHLHNEVRYFVTTEEKPNDPKNVRHYQAKKLSGREFSVKMCCGSVEMVSLEASNVLPKKNETEQTEHSNKDCDSLTEHRNILRPLCYISDRYSGYSYGFRETSNDYAVPRIFIGIFCFFFIWVIRYGDLVFKHGIC